MTGKKITVASVDINITEILNKLDLLKKKMSSPDLGEGASKAFSGQIAKIETELAKLEKSMPGAGASSAQIKRYEKNIEGVRTKMHSLVESMHGFEISDKYVEENIKGLQEYIDKLTAAKDKLQELKNTAGTLGADKAPQSKGGRGQGTAAEFNEARDAIRKAAKKGDREGVKKAYGSFSDTYKKRMEAIASTEGKDSSAYKAMAADREAMLSIERQGLALADRINKADVTKTQAEQAKTDAVRRGGEAAQAAMNQSIDAGKDVEKSMSGASQQVGQWADETKRAEEESKKFSQIEGRIKHLFSATMVFHTLRRVIRNTVRDFQELDKQFNEIAIVSNYSTKEMWDSFSSVNKVAQEFGVETKNVLEVQNLYYHQGKDMAEVNKLTAQTLTLAKITGMDYERATSDLTAALNAYGIAAEDAVRVTDTIAAMDTNAAISSEELMTALTKTASIAANAGMSLESTEVFLTKMIETTREAPENLGTALKTIIARFGEVKEEIDGEEIELADINRVDTALKSIGISLLDTAGQVRDLDGVFMELSSKWDDLDRNTQRYIATQAAGSRQQSRFIAMMENYDRTLELTEIAQNSAGLSARQLAKSQESIETSLNRLKSTWQEFTASIVSSGLIKSILEIANGVLSLVNRLNDISPYLGTVIAIFALWTVKTKIIDAGLIKLGQSMGEGIAQSSLFGTVLQALFPKLDAETQKLLKASGAWDAYAKSKAGANIPVSINSPLKGEKKRAFQKGYMDEKGKLTDKGRALKRENRKRKKEGKKELSYDQAYRRDLRKDGYNKTLQKLLGEEGAANFLKNKGAARKNGLKNIKGTIKDMGKVLKNGIGGVVSTISTGLTGILGSLGAILSVLGPIIGVVGAIVIAVIAWKNTMKASLDDTKKVEKLAKAQEEYNKQLQATNDLKKKSKDYEKYLDKTGKKRKNLTAEELEQEQALAKELVATYPQLLEKIDDEGNYHLKNAEAIEREIDAKERLLDQSAKTYNDLRLKYAKDGIYTDTSTQAGQAMKGIQDYAATFGTEKLNKNEDLKEIAKRIDKGTDGFNKSGFYDIMEAYATGKKSSFDNKDFTDLFAGDIGNKNWEELLNLIRDGNIIAEDGTVDPEALAGALKQTEAYSDGNAENVARTFVKLNNELGGLYGQLLQGAAYEQSEIYIQMARMKVDKFEFEDDISNDLKNVIGEAATNAAKSNYSKEEWIKLGDKRDELVENEIESWRNNLESLDKDELENMDKFIQPDVVLGAKQTNLDAFRNSDTFKNADTVGEMRAALSKYWEYIPTEIQKTMPEMDSLISSGSEEVIRTLFTALQNSLDNSSKESIQDTLNQYTDYASQHQDTSQFANRANIETFLSGMTGDQYNQLMSQLSDLDKDQFATYLDALYDTYVEKTATLGDKAKGEALNTLLKIDFTDMNSVTENMEELKKLGYTHQEVFELMMKATNDSEKITGRDMDSITKRIQKTIETFTKGIESMQALLSGTGSSEQMTSYMATMEDYYTTMVSKGLMSSEIAIEKMQSLQKSIIATGKGFKMSASSADDYADSLYQASIDMLNLELYALKASYAIAKTEENYEEMIRLQAAMNRLHLEAAMLDAKRQQARNDALVEELSKAKEKADQLLDSLKALDTWLRGFDRFINLDEVIEELKNDFDNLSFEIGFSTNTAVIAEDLQKQVDNINEQLLANQGGLLAAEQEKAMWRKTIEQRNSKYISFDENGNVVRNAEELRKLQEEINNASEERKPILQAEYDEIMNNVDAYTKAKKKVNDYTKATKENLEALEKFLKEQFSAITKVEDKLIQVRQAAEDKELEAVRKKYDAIKDENDKYLKSVRDMVDEERKIRDKAKREEDIKDKEKKLAMMKMDTSGVYASDIRQLEKELEQDYQDLEDNAVDEAIEKIDKQFATQAEALDKEIEYLNNALDYKREVMTEYNEWAQDLIKQGSDAVLAYLQANDEAYYTGTAAAQNSWLLEWTTATAQGVAANNAMATTLNPVMDNLLTSKQNALGFKGAVEEYSNRALEMNPQVSSTTEDLVWQYASLAEGVGDVTIHMNSLADAYNRAAIAASNLKAAQDFNATGTSTLTGNVPNNTSNPTKNPTQSPWKKGGTWQDYFTKDVGGDYVGEWDEGLEVWGTAPAGKLVCLDPSGLIYVSPHKIEVDGGSATMFDLVKEKMQQYNDLNKISGSISDEDVYKAIGSFDRDATPVRGSVGETVHFLLRSSKWKVHEDTNAYYKGYLTGGLADYTGPAWLDGTPSKPEMVLNPLQTQHFIQLVDVLDSIFSKPSISSPKETASTHSSKGDTYQFNIEVSQMANDYDVDRMIERIEDKMIKASRYRNVTTLTKKTL